MQIDSAYQPEAAAAKSIERPALHAINITNIPGPVFEGGQAVAMAADGFMAVVVPVTLDEGDVPGLVSLDAFKHARKLVKKGMPLHMELLQSKVRLSDGTEYKRPEGTFPDVMRIAPDTSPLTERTGGSMIPLTPGLLTSLARAMGSETVVVERFSEGGPMVAYPGLPRSEHMILDVPFGMVMPLLNRDGKPLKRPVDLEVAAA